MQNKAAHHMMPPASSQHNSARSEARRMLARNLGISVAVLIGVLGVTAILTNINQSQCGGLLGKCVQAQRQTGPVVPPSPTVRLPGQR